MKRVVDDQLGHFSQAEIQRSAAQWVCVAEQNQLLGGACRP